MNDLSQGLGGLLGGLGIRIPPPPQNNSQNLNNIPRGSTSQGPVHNNPYQTPPANTYRPNQQVNQPTSSFTTNPPPI